MPEPNGPGKVERPKPEKVPPPPPPKPDIPPHILKEIMNLKEKLENWRG